MSTKPQKCSICKKQGHNKLKCPGINTYVELCNILDIGYIKNSQKSYTENHYNNQRDMIEAIYKTKLQELRDNNQRMPNEEYFYKNIKEFQSLFQTKFLTNNDLTSLILLAPPGSGKTMIMDAIAYSLKTHINDEICILDDRFTVGTGMSSVAWVEQIKDNLHFFKNIEGFTVYHNPDFYKRIDYLIKNPLLLKNHYFIIDESHIASQLGNTIGKELKRLGLTKEIIKELNIKFILISATPDIMLKEFLNAENDDCGIIQMEPGGNYRGFNYFTIENYKSLENAVNRTELINTIKKLPSNKHHFIRVKSIKNVNKLRAELGNEGWLVIDYDQESNKYRNQSIDDVIKTQPLEHTFWFIKDMFRASKRLRINKHIGMVIEPFNKEDVSVTAQGLIPRWFGYYTDEDLIDCNIIFICNKKAVEKYKEFIKTGTYDNINYRSRMLNSKKPKPTHQYPYIVQKESVSEFDERINISLDELQNEMKTILGELPVNSGIGSIHTRQDGYKFSTKYCEKIDKSINHVDLFNYTIISQSILKNASLGKNLGKNKNDNKLIIIPFYNDKLELNSLQWCCRFYKV